MLTYIALSMVFCAILLVTVGVSLIFRQALAAHGAPYSKVDNFLHHIPVLAPLVIVFAHWSSQVPPTTRNRLKRKLVAAGGRWSSVAPEEFLAVSELVGITAGSLVMFVLLLGSAPLFLAIPVGMLSAFLFFKAPSLLLTSHVESRIIRINQKLPYMLDLLVLTLEAGSSFVESVDLFVAQNPKEPLAEEFALMSGELKMGKTRREAIQNLASRIDSEGLQTTLMAILQGEELGTPIARTLRIQSGIIRLKRTQRAEKIAAESSVKILGPTTLMMVAVLLFILAPAIIRAMRSSVFGG